MRKAYKTIISLSVVLIAGLNLIVPAFAQEPFTAIAIGGLGGASGAGLFSSMAGISGIDIGWPQSGSDPVDAMWNVLNPDHVYFSGEKHEATGQGDDIYDYITVDIGDWLSAQSDFIVNFALENQVSDNDSGAINITSSYGGYQFTNTSGSTKYGISLGILGLGTFTVGDYSVQVTDLNDANFRCYTYYNGNLVGNPVDRGKSIRNDIYLFLTTSNTIYFGFFYRSSIYNISNSVSIQTTSGIIDWESGTVNTSVFDGWENARVKIPHSISGLSTGWTIPDFTNAINNLWTTHQQGQIVIEDTDQPVPPPPVPSTPLGEVPFDDWIDLWGQGIYEQLENQSDALDFIGTNGEDAVQELESIDQNLQDIDETAESIDTNIGIGNGILGGIRSLTQSAVNYLEGIAEHVEELIQEIVEGTETLIAGILNQIPQAFGVIFGPIKQASSIWHYVVEWIQSIGAPFQFIWSMASGTSYYIILPVYASLAAAVVLAFYKRFGK